MDLRQCLDPMLRRSLILATLLVGATATHSAAQGAPPAKPPMIVINSGYRLLIDSEKGTIASFRSTLGVDRELLIPSHARLPLFKIEFLNDHSEFKTVSSSEAKEVNVSKTRDQAGQTVSIEYKEIGQLPVDARVTIRCPAGETLTYWNLEVNNRTTFWIGHIQFPVIEVPFDSPTGKNYSHILWSFADGSLAGPVEPSMPLGSWGGREGARGEREYDTPEIWRSSNYPGQWTATQLMAYYNDAGGLYVACDDPEGLPKFIDPLMERDGVTMGLGHYPGTRGPSETRLPYNVVIGAFHGDWYAAAEIYRNWASKQPFCATKLAQRPDYPKWLTDSPVGIMFTMRGQRELDLPVLNPEYTPLTNALPYLDRIAAGLDSPLMPVVFNWENAGPWVQPDSYPPVGGESLFREFMAKAKAKGWHPVLYGDGLYWVTGQKAANYDGMPYFRAHGGEAAVARKWDGTLFEPNWEWRKNYVVCVGTEKGRQMVLDMTRRMAELGPDVIQQFDQGPGPIACYATNHGHPPVPGPWMSESFKKLVKSDQELAKSINPRVAMSCEGAPPEPYLQYFQIWDARIGTCPLFSFVYHEYVNGQEGLYTGRISDEGLRASAARALVTGYMVNFSLRNKGLIHFDLLQTPWSQAIPDQAAILDWAKRINHFRAGVARDYLIYGRMLRPWTVSGVSQRDFGWGMEPGVMSGTWQAPDGRIGIVLANYADLRESPRLELEGQGDKKSILHVGDQIKERVVELPTIIDLEMEPRSLCLVEVK